MDASLASQGSFAGQSTIGLHTIGLRTHTGLQSSFDFWSADFQHIPWYSEPLGYLDILSPNNYRKPRFVEIKNKTTYSMFFFYTDAGASILSPKRSE